MSLICGLRRSESSDFAVGFKLRDGGPFELDCDECISGGLAMITAGASNGAESVDGALSPDFVRIAEVPFRDQYPGPAEAALRS